MYSLSKLSYLYIYFTAPIPKAYDPADYYFVGALIALSSAIFSAANNIVISLVCMKQHSNALYTSQPK